MNYESVPPPLPRVVGSAALVQKVGAVCGLAAAGVLVSTFPAAVRVSAVLAGDAPLVRAWAALGSAAIAPLALSIVVLRGARRGLREFGLHEVGLRGFGVGLWLTALLVTLSMFGSMLRATTHHRALAAVTYASGALVLAVGWALASARVVAILRAAPEPSRRFAVVFLGAVAVACVAFLGMRFARIVALDASSEAAGETVVDVIAFTLSAVGAACAASFDRRVLAVVGPPVAVFLAALGITTLRDPPVRHAIGEHAPAFVSAADLISGQ